MKEKQRKKLIATLKVVVSLALLYFIFTKINFTDFSEVLQSADLFWLLAALLFFLISKVFNALRLNLYFHGIDIKLTHLSNFKFYLLGMFYNLFLPGGIGGDAYKGYIIQKKYQVGTKKVVGVLLLDRLSGMLLILTYALALAYFVKIPFLEGYDWLLWICIPIGILLFWWMNKKWFSYAVPVFWGSIWYSAILQLFQIFSAYCLLKSFGVMHNELAYLFIFMISTIISVIPLTIGGIGSREVTFLYGAKWLDLDANTAIGISFAFFLISALVSLFGIAFHFKKPELKTVPNQ